MPIVVKHALAAALALLLAAPAAGIANAGEKAPPKPHMMYFYNPSCRLCTRATEVVGAVEEKNAAVMSRQRFNIADNETGADSVLYLFELLDEMEAPDDGGSVTLAVFLGLLDADANGELFFVPKRVLIEGDNIIENLEKEVADFLAAPLSWKGGTPEPTSPASFFSLTALASAPTESPSASGTNPPVRPRIRASRGDAAARAQARLRFGAISLAALADSVNPCAFATIIILVSMMSSARRSRREIVLVCLSFTASVFLTYFAIGLFLHRAIAEINQRGGWFLFAADLIYYAAFALCLIFGALSLRDAWLLFGGRAAEEMTLKLPKAFKTRINLAMARGVRASWLAGGVFVAGVTVSFLEAACTGQVYLPTIISIAKLDLWHTLLLLAWYNLLFVLPLLVIFGLVLWGVSSRQLADFFKNNLAWTKLALGLVFAAMGALLWFEMYWPPGYRGG
ncbi:MAG: hypothetical protein LBU23_07745 [Planctomycetota bacterium]|jgi:hypothetical protein|nr:hypothetical protein [Planctomycetota bacterium]